MPLYRLYLYLVGGDWNHGILNDFPYIGNVIIPTDELIFFRGVGQPPTSDSNYSFWYNDRYNDSNLSKTVIIDNNARYI